MVFLLLNEPPLCDCGRDGVRNHFGATEATRWYWRQQKGHNEMDPPPVRIGCNKPE